MNNENSEQLDIPTVIYFQNEIKHFFRHSDQVNNLLDDEEY